ncbi:hypothetical protein LTR10_017981 [Elasticomyces elasticus]|uniref:Uncharacterized protein n=1 Tax=Exophiala sideris TaxID=1016849 RepID=A0ABR0J9U0_9EURO|nr:hypothetical protein LTR10_017981 [Elasticomyces elasticus]KAK5026077.1 hypothetical protein LTS07_007602 [Exophiala sideris]KAK5032332.1 hypothetical protein LTR13_007155 [Exophiala sideris]KAK5059487.1 hypothetical protein LTR69_006076 [Exophiala sideris]KAK5186650.1 hypothetical protein LTR44_000656 [Eurotiomycetes sp. CCFEE 6388]
MSFTRSPLFPLFSLLTNLTAVGSATYYLQTWHKFNYEEHEARMDELEGTLRGHIGLIEESLDRLEGKGKESDRGKKMDEYYGKRERDSKDDTKK